MINEMEIGNLSIIDLQEFGDVILFKREEDTIHIGIDSFENTVNNLIKITELLVEKLDDPDFTSLKVEDYYFKIEIDLDNSTKR